MSIILRTLQAILVGLAFVYRVVSHQENLCVEKTNRFEGFMRQNLISACRSALAVALVLGACSCGKKAAQGVSSQPAPATTTQTPAQPAAAPQQTQVAQSTAQPTDPDLGEINRSLIRWVVGHKRRPANFEEFAASAGTPIPPPPAGKKYIIGGNMHVQLVNQ